MLKLPRVLAATDYAAAAHAGQRRKTGEPYVSHCIETALIVEANLPHWRQDGRHEAAVMAALLHDVLDDTSTTPEQITAAFGPAVSAMVVKVSKLSQVNQMLRRDKRKGLVSSDPSYWESQWRRLKRMMFEAVVEEPLVILVKLADRLHNMRTVYALPPTKQQAVAEETLAVWCSMAASLGWHRLKSEMEDLCFAVVDPTTFCTLRHQLGRLWASPPQPRSRRKVQKTRRQEQLQAFAEQQEAMAAARAQARGGRVQGLRDLRGLLAFQFGSGSRSGLCLQAPHRQKSADSKQLVLVADATESTEAQQQQFGMSAAAVSPESSSYRTVLPTSSSSSSDNSMGSSQGLHLSRPWPDAAEPLLPAPPDKGTVELQRASGGDWGVTDAAESLKALLHQGYWDSRRQTQQLSGSDRQRAGKSQLRTDTQPEQQLQPQQKQELQLTVQQQVLHNILSTVVPFDAVGLQGNPRLTWSAQQGLKVLDEAATKLYNELAVGSFSSGLEVTIQGRLKSLRSVHNKMQRKSCGVEEVYDARALRVVVDDCGSKHLADAVQCCYRLVSAVHKIWRPIHGEFDDYIANPKPSGYQALHTAVWGPSGAALEVQIKTSSMHEHAEYGGAAHWAYKEVVWGSAPAAVAAVNSIGLGQDAALDASANVAAVSAQMATAAGKAAARIATAAPLQFLPAVMFTFDANGQLVSSSEGGSAAAASSSCSTNGSKQSFQDLEAKLQQVAKTAADFAAGFSSSNKQGNTASSAAGTAAAMDMAGKVGVASSSLLERVVALSQQQQQEQPSTPSQQQQQAVSYQRSFFTRQQQHLAVASSYRQSPAALARSASVAVLERPSDASALQQPEGTPLPDEEHQPPRRQQAQQQQVKQLQEQWDRQSQWPLPAVYAGQPVLRISDRLRYGVVLAVSKDSSSTLRAASGTDAASSHNSSSTHKSHSSNSSSTCCCERLSCLCVIMSGGTNPNHPWRMNNYDFYQQLLAYAVNKGWSRPGQGDWHARLEEYKWCRDSRWHRRDHMGYLHPHTTVTLLEGFEQQAAALATAPVPVPVVGATALSSQAQDAATLLRRSWATGGSAGQQHSIVPLLNSNNSSRSHATASSSSSSSSSSLQLRTSKEATDSSPSQKRDSETRSKKQATGSNSDAAGTVAGSDWAVTAAKAAQLRSIIEWGLEAYGVSKGQQQSSEVSVVIWPGGQIEEVPRGTTAGEILREKGVFAIMDATDGAKAVAAGVVQGREAATSTADVINANGVSSAAMQQQGSNQMSTVVPDTVQLLQQPSRQQRLVNVNNRLVSEDTVLSDGDLVILAREKIKI
eukprot:GHRR01005816.1.p1 GENE.GHRR01005816.1~~GHRR01005816.1.p1  ORF type:complete len:1309 (+),score=612.22 GHRR01005816.1:725-4651(+)